MSSFQSYSMWHYYSCEEDCESYSYAENNISRIPIFTLNDLKNMEKHFLKLSRKYKSGYSMNLIVDLSDTLKVMRMQSTVTPTSFPFIEKSLQTGAIEVINLDGNLQPQIQDQLFLNCPNLNILIRINGDPFFQRRWAIFLKENGSKYYPYLQKNVYPNNLCPSIERKLRRVRINDELEFENNTSSEEEDDSDSKSSVVTWG